MHPDAVKGIQKAIKAGGFPERESPLLVLPSSQNIDFRTP